MKIGVAAPVSLRMLAAHFPGELLPIGYEFAPMATWIEQLISRGHQVVVFTHCQGITDGQTFTSSNLTIHIARQRANHRARDFYAHERGELQRFMLADRCDIIHAHWTYEFAMAALDSGIPTLVTAHDAPLQVLRYSPDPYRFVRLLMAISVACRAKHMTAVSNYLAEQYRHSLLYRSEVSVIPNAVPEEAFQFGQWRLEHPNDGPFTIACVLIGFKGRKNGPAAIEAFAKLRLRIPDARLLLFGGEYAPGAEAEHWACSRNLQSGIEFCGRTQYCDLLFRLSREVDVLLHPSREESFCMAAAEAMALGLPVIAGKNAGALPELIQHEISGLLVDIHSSAEMALALERLERSPELRAQIGYSAHISARKCYSLTHVFDLYEQLYGQIC